MRDRYRKISYFAVLLALSFVMPYLIHLTVPAGGKTFLPMHIPVQLAGFLIGPFAGFLLGIVAPPFNFIISGMPPFPLFIAMMLELGAMGFFAGLFHRRLKFNIFLSLTFAIFISKIFLALGWWLVFLIGAPAFLSHKGAIALTAGAIMQGIPGIIVQFIIVPSVVVAVSSLEKHRIK